MRSFADQTLRAIGVVVDTGTGVTTLATRTIATVNTVHAGIVKAHLFAITMAVIDTIETLSAVTHLTGTAETVVIDTGTVGAGFTSSALAVFVHATSLVTHLASRAI